MGGTACKTKVILNGSRAEGNLNSLCYLVEETSYDALTDEQWKDIAKHLNDAEDASNRATKAFLDHLGYDGPVDHSLRIK